MKQLELNKKLKAAILVGDPLTSRKEVVAQPKREVSPIKLIGMSKLSYKVLQLETDQQRAGEAGGTNRARQRSRGQRRTAGKRYREQGPVL